MGRIAFLTDRSPAEALPALPSLDLDVKADTLEERSLAHLDVLALAAAFIDAVADPARACRLLAAAGGGRRRVPLIVVVNEADLERHPFAEIADEIVMPTISSAELRVRLSMLSRRSGGGGEAMIWLGPLVLNTETYRVSVGGRSLDLTFKEFELLRFLVGRANKVFTRSELLMEVWGYDFYGGTRTVDVHVRRLRAKLGAEHESLIQTVRGVGYRAVEPGGADQPRV